MFCTERFRTISSPQESKDLTASKMPAIVISSSGMATGGRVLHHLKAALPDPRNTVLLVGFQAAGTRGRQLVDGAPAVKIHGQMIPVHARVEKIDSMSAHADSAGDPAMARRLQARPADDVPRPRRARRDGGAAGVNQGKLGWKTKMPDQESRRA